MNFKTFLKFSTTIQNYAETTVEWEQWAVADSDSDNPNNTDLTLTCDCWVFLWL